MKTKLTRPLIMSEITVWAEIARYFRQLQAQSYAELQFNQELQTMMRQWEASQEARAEQRRRTLGSIVERVTNRQRQLEKILGKIDQQSTTHTPNSLDDSEPAP